MDATSIKALVRVLTPKLNFLAPKDPNFKHKGKTPATREVGMCYCCGFKVIRPAFAKLMLKLLLSIIHVA